jgi:hypothetical protein
MKTLQLSFFLLLFVLKISAQDTTNLSFALDTLRVDSFFLLETTTFKANGAKRSETYERPVFFSDTIAFNLYIESRKQRLVDLEKQKDQIGVEYTQVSEQITALENLRDSVFRGMTGFGFLRQLQPAPELKSTKPPKFSETTATSWYIYEDPKGKEFGTWFVPYKPDVPIKNDGYLLKPDGTFEKVRRPKGKAKN